MDTTILSTLSQYGIGIFVMGFMLRYFMLELKEERKENRDYLERQENRNIAIYDKFALMQQISIEHQEKTNWMLAQMSDRINALSNGVKCVNQKGE